MLLALIIDSLILHVFSTDSLHTLLPTLLIGTYVIVYVLYLRNDRVLHNFEIPLICGLCLRIGLLYFDIFGRNIYILPNSGADSEWFYHLGVAYAQGDRSMRGVWSATVGTLFSVIGDNRLFVQFILMLFSIFAIEMMIRSLDLLQIDLNVSIRTVTIICLLPNFAILSSLFLRESVVAMFVAISIFFFLKWVYCLSLKYLVFAFIAVLLGSSFHSGIAGMIPAYIIAIMFFNPATKEIRISFRTIISALLFLFVFMYLLTNYTSLFFDKLSGFMANQSISSIANTLEEGGSSYAAYVGDSNSIQNLIFFTPIRMFFFLGSPFIWQLRGVRDIIALLFNAFFYLFIIFKSFGYIYMNKDKNRIIIGILLLIALTTAFVFSWGVTNTGTAIRHRDKMVVLYGILLSLVYSNGSDKGLYSYYD